MQTHRNRQQNHSSDVRNGGHAAGQANRTATNDRDRDDQDEVKKEIQDEWTGIRRDLIGHLAKGDHRATALAIHYRHH